MKNKLLVLILICAVVIAVFSVVPTFSRKNQETDDWIRDRIVAVNEIEQSSDSAVISQRCVALEDDLRAGIGQRNTTQTNWNGMAVGLLSICVMLGIYAYIYRSILHPFESMKQYAGEIAAGNFDMPLAYEKTSYFGAFTWAFDAMRCEIRRARASEQEQIENNKTVIATLTHDIMTPVASIRAYVEGLEACLEQSVEKRMRYLSVIRNKCDEVGRLCDDLFLHSLSEMDKLLVRTERVNISALLKETVAELELSNQDISLNVDDDAIYAQVDQKRFVQIIENLVNNARKYAKTDVTITLKQNGSESVLTVRDHGPGIPDEDLPFVQNKFYRGKNCGQEKGSGLGLYIITYLVNQMHGKVLLQNQNGFMITISFS